jgi:hypothetical protein
MLTQGKTVGFFREGQTVYGVSTYAESEDCAAFPHKEEISLDGDVLIERDLDPFFIPSRVAVAYVEDEALEKDSLRQANLRLNFLEENVHAPVFDRKRLPVAKIGARLTPFELYQMKYENVFYVPRMLSANSEDDPNCVIEVEDVPKFSVQFSTVTLPPFLRVEFVGVNYDGKTCTVRLKTTSLPIEDKPFLINYYQWIRRKGNLPNDKGHDAKSLFLGYERLVSSKLN